MADRAPATVLFVDHAPAMGGAEHSLLGLLGAIDRARYRPVLAGPEGPLARAARDLGVAVRVVPLARLRGTPAAPWRALRGTLALRRVVAAERADILHANVLRAALYAAPVARLTRRRLVWHVRDILASGRLAQWLCAEADAVVAISRATAEALPCAEGARVVPNPVAVASGRPRSRAELGLPTEGPLVAAVGRLRPWKGQMAFLDGAARVADTRARFVVIGGRIFDDAEASGYGAALEIRAQALGLGERVTFTGQRDDLADIWPHLALVVHAARAEPFGRVVAEAQAAGLPVVAYRDGGVPEIVAHDETGILVPPGDVDGLAAAITALLADPERRARMGRAGRVLAARRFAPSAHARAIERVYDGLLEGGG